MQDLETFPRSASSHSGGSDGYTVEARLAEYQEPVKLENGLALTNRWKRIDFPENPQGIGVPACKPYEFYLTQMRLLSYPSAQALRWWLHAQAANVDMMNPIHVGLALETRLIKHNVKYSLSATPVSMHGYIHGEDRSSIIPDWGVKPSDATQAKGDKPLGGDLTHTKDEPLEDEDE